MNSSKKYAEAALKDLKILITDDAKTYVEQILTGYNYIDVPQEELYESQRRDRTKSIG